MTSRWPTPPRARDQACIGRGVSYTLDSNFLVAAYSCKLAGLYQSGVLATCFLSVADADCDVEQKEFPLQVFEHVD